MNNYEGGYNLDQNNENFTKISNKKISYTDYIDAYSEQNILNQKKYN